MPESAETAAYRPFCSERCKKIDLAAWLDGKYRISRPAAEEDLDEGPRGHGGDGEEPERKLN